ncbi:hypothetical protein SDC9_199885 [bioreactor metagenome]|uniref:Uncharacterized protein n=1 Tax=bioreactor metagenome TaxID=1076179 RepID=A0A645IPA1_9ZZZZ
MTNFAIDLPPISKFFILLLIHDNADDMILSHEGQLPLPMRFIVVTITQAHQMVFRVINLLSVASGPYCIHMVNLTPFPT